MGYENEYYTKNSVRLYMETEYERDPREFYTQVLEKTRGWNMSHRHLTNLIKIMEKNFSHEDNFHEKTTLFLNALINNSPDMS